MDVSVGAVPLDNGWFGVTVADGEWSADRYPSIWSLWQAHDDVTACVVGAPVALPSPETGRRECDMLARQMLGRHGASVYYAPTREAVHAPTLAAAKTANDPAGFGIETRAWRYLPRIRGLDELLDAEPTAEDTIKETRPELCYLGLAEENLDHAAGSPKGVDERKDVLTATAPAAPVATLIDRFTEPRYAPSVTDPADVLGGIAAAITARRVPEVTTLPAVPPTDDRGRPLGIVYPGDDRQLRLSDL